MHAEIRSLALTNACRRIDDPHAAELFVGRFPTPIEPVAHSDRERHRRERLPVPARDDVAPLRGAPCQKLQPVHRRILAMPDDVPDREIATKNSHESIRVALQTAQLQ